MKYFSINLPPPIQHRKIPNTLKAGYPILGIDANESTQETIAYGCQQSQKNFKGKVMNTQSTTPVHALQDLQQYANAEALTPALHDLCSHFGSIKKLVVLTAKHEGIKQAICFLRLASEDQEKTLMQSLGLEKFGEEVVIVVDLKPTDQGHEFHSHLNWRSDNSSRHMAFHAA